MKVPDLFKLPSRLLAKKSELPEISAVYFCLNSVNEVLYIGRSVNLKNRWEAHHRYCQLKDVDGCRICWMECDRDLLDDIEQALIEWFEPSLNGEKVPRLVVSGERPSKSVMAMAEKPMAIRWRLHVVLSDRRMTHTELAKRIGVKRATVSGWCSSDRVPSFRDFNGTVDRICEALNCSISDLIERS